MSSDSSGGRILVEVFLGITSIALASTMVVLAYFTWKLDSENVALVRDQVLLVRDEIELAEGALEETKRTREQGALQFSASLAEAKTARQQAFDQFRKEHASYLVIEQEIAVAYVQLTPTGVELITNDAQRNSMMPRVLNLGSGPAVHVKVLFFLDEVEYVDGSTGTVAINENPTPIRIHLPANDGSPVLWIPSLIRQDRARQIRAIGGTVQMTSKTTPGDAPCFYQLVRITPDYSSQVPMVRFKFSEFLRGNCSTEGPFTTLPIHELREHSAPPPPPE